MLKKGFLLIMMSTIFCTTFMSAQNYSIGGRVVFISNRTGWQNLWILDLETKELTQITDFPGSFGITSLQYPQWSKDGKKVLFSGRSDRSRIYIVDVEEKTVHSVPPYPDGQATRCSWDPVDENSIYAYCSVSGKMEYHKVNLLTLEDHIFLPSSDYYDNNSSGDDGEDITTDGTEMIFSRDVNYSYSYIGYQDTSGNLIRILPLGPQPRTEIGRINRQDGWVLCHHSNGFPAYPPFNIEKFDKDGQTIIQLTSGEGNVLNSSPCWTTGGNDGYILFNSNITGDFEIMLMKADGASYPDGMINLTNNPASDIYPDWTPYGSKHFTFDGFFSPINNIPTVNKANAGQTIPVKWRITDKNGLPIADPASFKSITSYSVNCAAFAGDPTSTVVEELAAGSSGLQYQGDGWWQFNWKTSKSYKGQCRVMKLTLDDHSEHTASFSFK